MTHPIGFLVNPVAGTGGRFAHKGSDDPDLRAEAIAKGVIPTSQLRARMAAGLLSEINGVELMTWGGPMGSDWLTQSQSTHHVLGTPGTSETSRADTVMAGRKLVHAGVELIVFVGGDGTARDLHDAVGSSVPVIGVPGGVKMYSGVFSPHPRVAVRSVRRYFTSGRQTALAEVIDLDESSRNHRRVETKLYGYMSVPKSSVVFQGMKSPTPTSDSQAIAQIAQSIASKTDVGSVVVLGAGSTVLAIGDTLGLSTTLLGVDIVTRSSVLVADGDESSLIESLSRHPASHLIVSPIGGQGFVFGRGNQQLSPTVLQQIGRENLTIVATPSKLHALGGRPLLVDTGDEDLDQELAGWSKVIVGRDETAVYRVQAAGSIAE